MIANHTAQRPWLNVYAGYVHAMENEQQYTDGNRAGNVPRRVFRIHRVPINRPLGSCADRIGRSRQSKKAAQTGGFPNALSAKSTASADDYIFIAVR